MLTDIFLVISCSIVPIYGNTPLLLIISSASSRVTYISYPGYKRYIVRTVSKTEWPNKNSVFSPKVNDCFCVAFSTHLY